MKTNKGGWWALLIALLIATIFAALYAPRTAAEQKQIGFIAATSTQQVLPVEPPKSTLPKVLADISWCESKDDQSKIGYNYRFKVVTDPDTGATSTVKYLWSKDIGRFQINEYYHAARAKRLGFDIYSEAGNLAYALLLYNENGTRDWLASRGCWQNIDAAKAKNKSYY